jgi:hypothetical protein
MIALRHAQAARVAELGGLIARLVMGESQPPATSGTTSRSMP